ncbi:serine O-acetyltransferase [Confluentibacter flavum]|uniref:Serine acetyltransferase n=1 Tax=Confluentibacter flavum TaxID=1909700 RepID=A0A2N3HGH3_9FLAO|nr:serine acetyltransferase [Confluentibacter flavum]PKQ44067.1 serine acetyltransferase [Confluentibacter flavum]
MIKSKQDYLYYLKADRKALNIPDKPNWIKEIILPNYIWVFQKRLRKLEYLKNCRNDLIGKITYVILKVRFRKLGIRLGFSIPENIFGPGLSIAHYGTIVVNSKTKVGKNCRIHVCTNIGASGGNPKAPVIGDNVYIAPGVKIYGDIEIGNNIAIAPNSSVNKTFLEPNVLIAGSPAKIIKKIDISKLIPNSTE